MIPQPETERSVGDRHGGTGGRAQRSLDPSVELQGERLDDARAQSGRCRAGSVRRSDPIVGNAEPSARLLRLIGDDDQAGGRVGHESMLEGVDDELRDDQTDADGGR